MRPPKHLILNVYGYCILAGLVYLTVRRVESAEPPSLPRLFLFGCLMGLAVMVRRPTPSMRCCSWFSFAARRCARCSSQRVRFALLGRRGLPPNAALVCHDRGARFYYSYVARASKFMSPELFNYCSRSERACFFWHPIYLLMIVALLVEISAPVPRGRRRTEWLRARFYLGASWGDFTFGGSFGSRQSSNFLPVMVCRLQA